VAYLENATLIKEFIEGDQIVLDNVPMRVERGVGYQLSNAYPRKTQQGDPGPDDHPYNSTNTQRTWVNGCLVRDSEEAADVGNWWDGLAWTQTKGQLSAPLRVIRLDPGPDDPGGMTVPHVRMGENFIWTKGNLNGTIYEYRAVDGALRHLGGGAPVQFSGTVTNVGVMYQVETASVGEVGIWLYIPTTAGYTRIASDDFERHLSPDAVSWATVGFATNENKLYRLTTQGQVFFAIDHSDTWTLVGTISDGSEPRNIYQTSDDDGNRCIGVTTSSGLFLLDHDNALLVKTDFWFPEHAYNGYGAALWRAQDYISNGVGVQRKVGLLITQEGLDNRDGLPFPFAGGFFTDLEPSYNWLVGAVAGQTQGADLHVTPVDSQFGLTMNIPYPIVSSGAQANFLGINRKGAIYIYNGLGWAPFYKWNRPPTRVVVSMIQNATLDQREQHMFFGDVDGGAFVARIPAVYYNPIQSPNLPVEREWYLEESRIDWNLKDVPKIAKQLNIKADHLWHVVDDDDPDTPNTTATLGDGIYQNRIQVICNWLDPVGIKHTSEDLDVLSGPGPYPFVSLREVDPDDDDPPPTALRGLTPVPYLELRADSHEGNSRRSAPIGWERYKNTGEFLPTGLPHEAIWLTYRGINDDRDPEWMTTGVVEWRSIISRKWARPNRVFTFQISASTAIKGMSEEEVLDFLDGICLKVGGVPLVTGDAFYIVDVTRLDGSGEPGLSPRGARTITCLEFTDLVYEQQIDGP